MKVMEKILFATDFNQSANDAMKTALLLAKTFHSEIILIHVVPEIEHLSLSQETLKENVKKLLDNVNHHISNEGVTTSDPILLFGEPFDLISTYGDINNVNVIVLGAGEKQDTYKFPLGITAGRIIRSSKKPVWIVKKDSPPRLKKIVCPIDLSDSSERALKNAIHLARKFDARLTVLNVIKPPSSLYLKMHRSVEQEQKRLRKFHLSQFEAFLKKMDFYKVTWDKAVRDGNPAEEILSFVSGEQPDLLVMGTVGRTGLDRILMGSVAEKVTRELPCSTMMVKSESPFRLKMEDAFNTIKSCFKQGHELLEEGFAPEAAARFEHCVFRDVMFAPGWEGLASAYSRLGRDDDSRECLERAIQIRRELWEKQVRFEILKQKKIE